MEEMHIFSRAELLLGKEKLKRLRDARVAVFGIGGVGSFAAEALARGGIGHIALIDGDVVSLTNINRQLIATHKTIGREKTAVMAERIHDICPETEVLTYPVVYGGENRDLIDFASYDYIVDAIDMVSSKLLLIEEAKKAGTEIISCMGTGNKFDPTRFEVADISKTSVCPLAKVMRKELKERGIRGVKVVYSKEIPVKPADSQETGRRQTPGSLSFVPPAAGLLLAGEVIRHIAGITME
ncbi:MAG: tRNA threonylcarbamoyladenosine dehydratase [Bacillota bacterium]|nr:tRNA threonylcarbamoyladenosine dehydratase [Bacillota bacterium]